ncbi:flagellin [Achromobacter sp. HZ01]|uniref:FliC/FljB family flagellin n=1 Tax=Achromobacter sp. HZ01 TaxID=1416886 RepID=UPI000DC482AC|nr:FliC/FljB family flagellin [Achromobacter sp. HZ01]RAP65678.1 flagellin [Achromobacter sp. HZ01]
MAVINTNYLSLVAQNNLNKSQSSLGNAIERLSSGLRINSAKDDAAGQAIANRFTANVNGLTQAARNANDGISIAQTTEGALNEINNNLQRIRQLTVQASNGTNSDSDMASIQAEITQRLDEIDRVSQQTQFNGISVLKNGVQALDIQVGANDNETITINLEAIDRASLDLTGFSVRTTIDGSALTAATIQDTAGDTATGGTTFSTTKADGSAYAAADFVGDATNGYFVKDSDGSYRKATFTVTTGTAGDGSDSTVSVTVGAKATNVVASAAEASTATANPLAAIDNALAKVDTLRSDLGAIQNRFESTVANLNNTVNNLSAARSRIEDADYATEVSNMTKAQILQQAGTSVLAQANQVPQTVLSLLR